MKREDFEAYLISKGYVLGCDKYPEYTKYRFDFLGYAPSAHPCYYKLNRYAKYGHLDTQRYQLNPRVAYHQNYIPDANFNNPWINEDNIKIVYSHWKINSQGELELIQPLKSILSCVS